LRTIARGRKETERLLSALFLPGLRTRNLADITTKELTDSIDRLLEKPCTATMPSAPRGCCSAGRPNAD
jgi:hypothetical protein